ncbi:hypothetical protein PTKIN_Ptkin16aG0096500 [Pterospermum kingtungense]
MMGKEKVGLCNTLFLPLETETEILARLPVKSLLRFKCVQQSWCNLIEDPTFITKHLNLIGKSNTSFFYRRFRVDKHQYYQRDHTRNGYLEDKIVDNIVGGWNYEIVKSSTKRLFRGSELYIVGSCDGLICVRNQHCGIYIWNPSTRKILEIPVHELPECDYREDVHKSCLAYFLDFGFCPKLYDYKVVLIICSHYHYHSPPLGFLVYSLGTNTWKKITLGNPAWDILRPVESKRSIIINGASYWLAQELELPRKVLIVAFKFDEEVILEINLPNNVYFQDHNRWNPNLLIAEYENLLSVISSYDNIGNVCDVWVMKEYGVADSWVKQFTIEVPLQPRELILGWVFLNFENNGELVLVPDDVATVVVWYNIKTNQFVRKLNLLHPIGDLHWCKQSLVSLPGETSAEFLEK